MNKTILSLTLQNVFSFSPLLTTNQKHAFTLSKVKCSNYFSSFLYSNQIRSFKLLNSEFSNFQKTAVRLSTSLSFQNQTHDGNHFDIKSEITVLGCMFKSCANTENGGAINVQASGTSQNSFNSCIFSQCQASLNGGAIFIISDQVIFNNISFESNSAQKGGSIFAQVTSLSLSSILDNQSTSKGDGGSIYVECSDNFTMRYIHFSGCTSSGNGGAIYLSKAVNEYPVNVYQVNATSCSASLDGSSFYFNASLVNLYDVFISSSAPTSDHSIVKVTGQLSMTSIAFQDNLSTGYFITCGSYGNEFTNQGLLYFETQPSSSHFSPAIGYSSGYVILPIGNFKWSGVQPVDPLDSAPTSAPLKDDGGLEGWEIALIVICCVAFVFLLCAIVFFVVRRNRGMAGTADPGPEIKPAKKTNGTVYF